jgi:hypothetical protein
MLIKFGFSRQNLEKSTNIKFHENLSSGSPVVLCAQPDVRTEGRAGSRTVGQTRLKVIVIFQKFSTAPKIVDTIQYFEE